MSRQTCNICPRHCTLEEGESGYCCARSNHDGEIRNDNYGMVTFAFSGPYRKNPCAGFIRAAGFFPWAVTAVICAAHFARIMPFPWPMGCTQARSISRRRIWCGAPGSMNRQAILDLRSHTMSRWSVMNMCATVRGLRQGGVSYSSCHKRLHL